MIGQVFGVDLPDESSDLLFHFPFAVNEEHDNDGDQEDAAQDAGGDLRVAVPVVRVATLFEVVAARRFVQWRSVVHPGDVHVSESGEFLRPLIKQNKQKKEERESVAVIALCRPSPLVHTPSRQINRT